MSTDGVTAYCQMGSVSRQQRRHSNSLVQVGLRSASPATVNVAAPAICYVDHGADWTTGRSRDRAPDSRVRRDGHTAQCVDGRSV